MWLSQPSQNLIKDLDSYLSLETQAGEIRLTNKLQRKLFSPFISVCLQHLCTERDDNQASLKMRDATVLLNISFSPTDLLIVLSDDTTSMRVWFWRVEGGQGSQVASAAEAIFSGC